MKKLTKIEKIDKAIKRISNLEPKLEQNIIFELNKLKEEDLLNTYNNVVNFNLIIKNGKAYGIQTKLYWIRRGWSNDQSAEKSKTFFKNKPRDKTKSVYNIEYWLNKGFSKEEATFNIKCRRSTNIEYWLNKGFSKEEATQKLSDRQSVNFSEESKQKLKQNSLRTLSGWINKGYSVEEAKEKLKQSQGTFSKEKCIKKYGEEKGFKIFNQRQEKWQSTLNLKTNEEMTDINRKKVSSGYTYSKNETALFESLKLEIPDVQRQLTLQKAEKGYYSYDISFRHKIIEYNGDFWHMNSKFYNDTDFNGRTKKTALEQWNSDKDKIEYAKNKGYEILTVWESDFNSNKERVIQECLNFLKQ